MDDDSEEFWAAICGAALRDSDSLMDALRWHGSRAYLIVSIAGYDRPVSVSKVVARSILRDRAHVRALEYEDDVYLIADGVE